jgi:hypothetical protein
MATPVLGPETKAENKNNNVNLTRIEKERLERLKKLNPEVPKERTLMEKLVDQLRKSLTGKNIPTDVALAERRLQAGKYSSMDDDTYDPASMRKKPKPKPKPKPKSKVIVSSPMPLTAAQLEAKAAEKRERDLNALIMKEDAANYRERGKNADNSNFRNVKVPVKPKTIGRAAGDKFQSVPQSLQEEETEKRSSVTTAKKKRDRLFGLDFLPEIDSKEGGDKINLPFGLGSYETLPIEDDLVSSRNKKGGRINRKSGGKIRKAGCKRGMGKAMRGY